MTCPDDGQTNPCGVCGHATRDVVCLGVTPLANALLARPDDEVLGYPLHVVVCPDCDLVQLTRQVPPATMFGGYPYYSSQSRTMVDSAARLAARMISRFQLDAADLVVEIGSNDGYLLRHYADAGVPVLGFDPADGPADMAEAHGVPTVRSYFDEGVDCDHDGQATVVHANNVLAHVPNPDGVLAGAARLLAPDGVLIIETPWLGSLLEGVEFDTIYHEHRWYWSVAALRRRLRAAGLTIAQVEWMPLHGGSIRVFARRFGEQVTPDGIDESGIGVGLETFAARVDERIRHLGVWWDQLATPIAGYGAAAKATMLCTAADLRPAFIVDSTPAKQGRWLPGVDAQILSPTVLDERHPPNCVLFAWNFAHEIVAKTERYVEQGGTVWTPTPEPRIVAGGRVRSS